VTWVLEAMRKGGPVMWPIAMASVVAWALAFACRRETAALGRPGGPDPAALAARLRLLAALVAVLPLLGLLGTVEGLIVSFEVIRQFGNGEPRMMAGGLRRALLTTEAGLVTAIPLLILHRHLAGRLERHQRHARARSGGSA
jgi:biopolymer transport protein ExbB/TolQ